MEAAVEGDPSNNPERSSPYPENLYIFPRGGNNDLNRPLGAVPDIQSNRQSNQLQEVRRSSDMLPSSPAEDEPNAVVIFDCEQMDTSELTTAPTMMSCSTFPSNTTTAMDDVSGAAGEALRDFSNDGNNDHSIGRDLKENEVKMQRLKAGEKIWLFDNLFVDKNELNAMLKNQNETKALQHAFPPCNKDFVPFPDFSTRKRHEKTKNT